MTIVLGIDPGTRICGYGLVEDGDYVECGVLRERATIPARDRIDAICQALGEVIDEFRPDECAIETAFVGRGKRSSMVLGQGRGAIRQVVVSRRIPVAEYTPSQVKLAVAGFGGATKEQVRSRVQLLMDMVTPPTLDASDALAVAMAHERLRLYQGQKI